MKVLIDSSVALISSITICWNVFSSENSVMIVILGLNSTAAG